MTTQNIKTAILQGDQFSNERADWFTVCKPAHNVFSICIREQYFFYKNIDSAARRIKQLMNKGY